MSPNQVLTILSLGIFVLLSCITAVDYFRHRNSIRRDIALMFGSLGVPMAVELLEALTGLRSDLLEGFAYMALVAQPYLLSRLIHHFQQVPTLVSHLAFGGMIVSWMAFILFGPSRPPVIELTIASYFVIINGYAMFAFIRGAFVFSGVTSQRLRFAAAGSGLLAVVLGMIGITAIMPSLQNILPIVTQWSGMVSALCFYIGFAPPRWLRRVWQFAELREFLVRLGAPYHPNQLGIVTELGTAANRAVGGAGSMIVKMNSTSNQAAILYSTQRYESDVINAADNSAIRLAWQNQAAVLLKRDAMLHQSDRQLFDTLHAETLIVVPIDTTDDMPGLLLVFLKAMPLFPDDDLELLRLLAQQSAIFLENIRLIEQLQDHSESLEKKVEARTQALVHSEVRFRNIFERAGVGLAEISLDGHFIQVNQHYCDIVGYTAEELRRLTFRDITHPDDLQVDPNKTRALIAEKIETYSVEKRYYHKTGRVLWVNVTTSLVHDPSSETTRLLKAVTDISERKQAEAERLRAETRFARVLNTTAEAVISINAMQQIILFNQSAERIFGYTASEALGQSLNMLLPPEVIQLHQQFIRAFADGDDTARGMGQRDRPLAARHKNGRIFPIEASISKLTEEEQIILTVFIRDVTEQKQAEAALLESERRYHTTLDNMLEGCQIIGFDWRYLYVNDSAARYGRQKKEDLLGHTLFEKFPGIENTEMYHVLQHCMEERTPRLAEFEFAYPDGTTSWFEFSIQPVTEGIFILSLDITDRKQTEEALLRLNEALEQRVQERTIQLEATNKELEAFSYSVSHDLRAPLRALDGFSQALLEDYENTLDDEGKEYLTLIRSESQRMGHLIDDLLNLARLTRTELSYEMVNLSATVQEIANELYKQDPQRQVECVIENDLFVCADSHLMRIALQNLMGNAWKYASTQPITRIEFGKMWEEDKTVYFIRDNGVGFDMKYAHKLFGAFQRLHATNEFEGTGIGLATVQRIIHQHGGTIRAHSIINQGATFFFTIGQLNCD